MGPDGSRSARTDLAVNCPAGRAPRRRPDLPWTGVQQNGLPARVSPAFDYRSFMRTRSVVPQLSQTLTRYGSLEYFV